MPNNTDNSGSARATRLRRIAAGKGPTPPVRPNIGSMALDSQLGKAECCDLCNPIVLWATSPILLTGTKQGSNWIYSAVYATVTASMPYQALFGPPPDGDPVEPYPGTQTNSSHIGNVWTVQFVFTQQQVPYTFQQLAAFNFTCTPSVVIENTLTYVIQ